MSSKQSTPISSVDISGLDDSTREPASLNRRTNSQSSFQSSSPESSTNDPSDNQEVQDSFDVEGIPMPRITSSSVPIVLEVAPRTGSFPTHDPLSGAVTLYDGHMTSRQRERLEQDSRQTQTTPVGSPRSSWFLPSVFSSLH